MTEELKKAIDMAHEVITCLAIELPELVWKEASTKLKYALDIAVKEIGVLAEKCYHCDPYTCIPQMEDRIAFLEDIIKRAKVAFFSDKPDEKAAVDMYNILSEAGGK